MKLIVMLLLNIICFSQIKVNKQTVIYNNQTLKIVDKKLLYKDTILYLENDSSVRISKNMLYFYAPQVYLKFKFDKKTKKYIKL